MSTTTERISARDFLAMQSAGSSTGRKQKPAASQPSESDIQATLVQALRQCGYEVLETGQDRSQLQGQLMRALRPFLRGDIVEAFIFNLLGKVLRSWGNNDAGCPDLIVTHPDWPIGEWLGLELKTPTGKVRPEQQRLADAGRVVICRGVYEGLEAVVSREASVCRTGDDAEWKAALSRGVRVSAMTGQFKEVK